MKLLFLRLYNISISLLLVAVAAYALLLTEQPESPFDAILHGHSNFLALQGLRAFLWLIIVYAAIRLLLGFNRLPRYILLADSIFITYLFAEFFFSLFKVVNGGGEMAIVTSGTVKPDNISGYRYLTGSHRQAYIYHGQRIFDNTFYGNNYGYSTRLNFSEKKDSGTYRFVVLGDSYTAASFNETNWPDMLNAKAAVKINNQRTEFYSFSLEGIGVPAWHNIFFQQITPAFDFDAVIIPVYYEDLFRRHVVLFEKNNRVYCLYTDSLPTSLNINAQPLSTGSAQLAVTCSAEKMDVEMDSLKSIVQINNVTQLYLLNDVIVPSLTRLVTCAKPLLTKPRNAPAATGYFIHYINSSAEGANDLRQLSEIIAYCKAHNKPVIICSVPDQYIVDANMKNYTLNEDNLIRAIAEHFGTPYFSGYACMSRIKPGDVPHYFWPDGHWNTAGSQIFADSLSVFLNQNHPEAGIK